MRPPFDMLRACFYLLAFVIASQVVAIIFGSWTCFYLLIVGMAKPGDCGGFGGQAQRDVVRGARRHPGVAAGRTHTTKE